MDYSLVLAILIDYKVFNDVLILVVMDYSLVLDPIRRH